MRCLKWCIAASLILAITGMAGAVTVGPGQSIQAAVNAASSGDTINVLAGTYNEMVSVTKPLSILGAGAGLSNLVPGPDFGFSVIGVSGVTISGFTVYKEWNPIWLDSVSNCTIENNQVIGGTGSFPSGSGYGGGGCIQLVANFGDSTDNTIRNNELSNMIIGVKLGAGSTGQVKNNVIENNTISGTNTAVRLRSDGALVSDNVITNNTLSDSTYGLYVWAGTPVSGIVVTGNELSNNAYGMRVTDGVDATAFTVAGNDIHGNSGYGVRNTGVGILDARYNWWGDASGPSGGVADPWTGRIASGIGDEVRVNVAFDPFIPEPVTMFGVFAGVAGLGGYLRKRFVKV